MFMRDTPPKRTSSSLVRSRSFGGFLNTKGLTSASSSSPPVLGQSFKSPSQSTPKRGLGGLSFSRKAKTPKVARPERALVIFKHVRKGIRSVELMLCI